ncbi:MAG TPA: DUF4810 domain-containing protein [Verrucomicrobiales bacterium]|nr:DUF4810 domain-containing protein [Verrucomicrobiales bacterium]
MAARPASAACLAALVLAGCAAPPTHYAWGGYESQVHETYAKPGKVSAEQQIRRMEEDFQKARSKDKPVHPGFHAHLGYLYYQTGKLLQARQEFETERAEFPESTVFMNRLLANIKSP